MHPRSFYTVHRRCQLSGRISAGKAANLLSEHQCKQLLLLYLGDRAAHRDQQTPPQSWRVLPLQHIMQLVPKRRHQSHCQRVSHIIVASHTSRTTCFLPCWLRLAYQSPRASATCKVSRKQARTHYCVLARLSRFQSFRSIQCQCGIRLCSRSSLPNNVSPIPSPNIILIMYAAFHVLQR